jgi:hypothetical protein
MLEGMRDPGSGEGMREENQSVNERKSPEKNEEKPLNLWGSDPWLTGD